MIRQPTHRSSRYFSPRMLCAALACATPTLHATTFTWLGLGNNNDWNDNTGNWNGSGANPYPGLFSQHDNVVLGAVSQRFTILLYSIIAIDGISVQAPYTLNITGDLIVQQPVTGSGLAINLTGGNLSFESSASAGSTTITADQNSELDFFNTATAASAVIDNAGILTFRDNTTAPNASVALSGGTLDVSQMVAPLTLGSLHDAAIPGALKLGSTSLTLQSAADQVFHGSVSGTGTITQAGIGTLILGGNNPAFAGSLKVQAGTLEVDGDFSSASVSVDGGATLSGGGHTGAVSLIDGKIVPSGATGATLQIASLACSDAQITFDLDSGGTRLVIDQALTVAQCPQIHMTLNTAQSIASGQSFDVATLSSGTDYNVADFSVAPVAGYAARLSVRANHVIVTLLDPADGIFADGFD